jgi:hypothetical protein
MRRHQLNDLAKLARQRTRESVSLVTQLTDSDEEAAAILLSVAVDLIGGAGVYVGEEDITTDGALISALHLICNIIGAERAAEAVAEAKVMADKHRSKKH